MVRFSCFLSPINHAKSKKSVVQSAGAMDLNPQENSLDQTIKTSVCSDNNLSNTSPEQVTTPSSHEDCWKSDDLTGNSCPDESEEFRRMTSLKKTQSFGSVLDKRRGFCGDGIIEEDEVDLEFSVNYFHDNNLNIGGDSFVKSGSSEAHEHGGATEFRDPEHQRSIFSIGVYGEQHDSDVHDSRHVGDTVHSPSDSLPVLAKSRSVTNLRLQADGSVEGGLAPEVTGPRSRSFEDLYSDLVERDEFSNDGNTRCSEEACRRHRAASYSQDTPEPSDFDGKGSPCHADLEEECALSNTSVAFNGAANQEVIDEYLDEKLKSENQSFDGFEPHNDDSFSNEWRELKTDGLEIRKNIHLQQDSSIQNSEQLTSEQFNIKRIEDWICQIDIQNGVVGEIGESSSSISEREPHISKKDPLVVAVGTTTKHGAHNPGMEVAYNYISSLPISSSSAHMSNLGLVAVPFLGAFSSLRVLNLSGNAIVRITAGALPRGLHMLNLSKNNISSIEGLRDLTRLRVLDLSFNRLLRIGHGLASCSSLKELYLAGNMISEVEGLHRLLKLNVLDLRSNKISKAKSLDRLAANYGSMQAINLDGNPALINVGGEHLKKYVMSLLPHLVYYNKQTTRASSSKDITDRSLRSLSSHQLDRGSQSSSRRGSHGSGLHRSISSSNVRASAAASSSVKQSKNRHLRLPPAGSKVTNQQAYVGTKLMSSRPIKPIHRSLSEGTL